MIRRELNNELGEKMETEINFLRSIPSASPIDFGFNRFHPGITRQETIYSLVNAGLLGVKGENGHVLSWLVVRANHGVIPTDPNSIPALIEEAKEQLRLLRSQLIELVEGRQSRHGRTSSDEMEVAAFVIRQAIQGARAELASKASVDRLRFEEFVSEIVLASRPLSDSEMGELWGLPSSSARNILLRFYRLIRSHIVDLN